MPIPTPSNSILTVQPTSVTSSAGALESRIISLAAAAAAARLDSARENRSKGRTASSVFSLGPASAASESPVLGGDRNIVATYSATVYDTEITSSGFTSAYPEILGIAPLVNLYDASGKFSNTGQIFKIQNTTKDRAISRASQIVEDYLEAFPDASASLAAIRDENLQKYNSLVSYLPNLLQNRESITYSSEITSYSDNSFATLGMKSSIATNEFNHLFIIPDTSDIKTYVGERDMTVSFSRRLLGVNTGSTSYNSNFQSKTARQSQLVRAAIAQLSEGLRFDIGTFGESGTESPYASLDESSPEYTGENTSNVISISNFLYDKFSPSYGFIYAKNQLEALSSTVMNNFCPPSSVDDYGDISQYYSQRNTGFAGLVYKNGQNYEPASNTLAALGLSAGLETSYIWSKNYLKADPSGLTSTIASNLPYFYMYQIGNLNDCKDFFNQSILSLAYEIMSLSKTPTPSPLPDSVNPGGQDSKISGNLFVESSGLKYTVTSRENKQIYLFDDSVKDDASESAVPISTALISSTSELEDISQKITEIQDSISDFTSGYGHIISPQCALTILQVFYNEYISFFTNSVLGGQTTDEKSAMRAAILIKAACDPITAGRLFRFLEDPNNNALRAAASGDTAEGGETKRKAFSSFIATNPAGQGGDPDGSYVGLGSLATFGRDVNAADYEIKTSDLGGTTCIGELGGTLNKINFNFEDEFDVIASYVFDEDGSLFTFQRIVDSLKEKYPAIGEIGESTQIAKKIKITSFLGLLYFIRCLKLRATIGVYPAVEDSWNEGIFAIDGADYKSATEDESADNSYSDLTGVIAKGFVRFYTEDSMFIADCLKEAFTVPSVDEMVFDNYNDFFGEDPSSSQKSRGASIFNRVRAPISYVLQASQDMLGLLSYQKTVLQNQIDSISSFSSNIQAISNIYGGDTAAASIITSRYLSLESLTELYYRSKRYQTMIPGTRISSIATRSKNYRSIVRSAFKNLIPSEEDLKLFMIGIPYGHLERLRLGQDERNFYFGVKINCGSTNNFSDDDVTISYDHDFIDQYFRTEESGGPYSSQIPELFDDFDSTEIVKSVENGNISLYRLRDDRSGIDILKRSEESTRSQRVDFPATVVQSALQSYMEDVYGLYPRFSSTKSSMRTDPYPEEEYANAALNFAGISTDTTEGLLIYNRLKSVIMMHQDFITTRMVEEQEASPLFDKIIYVVVQGASLPDVLTQIYARVEV